MTTTSPVVRRSAGTALVDSATMLGRELRHTRRYPMMLIASVLTPVVLFALVADATEGSSPGWRRMNQIAGERAGR